MKIGDILIDNNGTVGEVVEDDCKGRYSIQFTISSQGNVGFIKTQLYHEEELLRYWRYKKDLTQTTR